MYYDGATSMLFLEKTLENGFRCCTTIYTNLQSATWRRWGSGPIGVKEHLSKFLPSPIVGRREAMEDEVGVADGYWYNWVTPESTIGKVQQWNGNAGAVVRSWAFYRRYGRELETMSEHAVLNANYLRHVMMNPDPNLQIHAMPVEMSGRRGKARITLSMSL